MEIILIPSLYWKTVMGVTAEILIVAVISFVLFFSELLAAEILATDNMLYEQGTPLPLAQFPALSDYALSSGSRKNEAQTQQTLTKCPNTVRAGAELFSATGTCTHLGAVSGSGSARKVGPGWCT